MKTKSTLADRIRLRVTKRERAQSRLNRAAVAWAAHTEEQQARLGWSLLPEIVGLLRAVRAFQKAGKR